MSGKTYGECLSCAKAIAISYQNNSISTRQKVDLFLPSFISLLEEQNARNFLHIIFIFLEVFAVLLSDCLAFMQTLLTAYVCIQHPKGSR